MIGIAKEHEIIARNLKIKTVSFDPIYQGDMSEIVRGKRKSTFILLFVIIVIKEGKI